MEYKFSKMINISNLELKVGDHSIPKVTQIKYLWFVIQNNGEIKEYLNHQIQIEWVK